MNQTNQHQIVLSPAHLITIVVAMAGLMMLTVLMTTNMVINSQTVSAEDQRPAGSVASSTVEGCNAGGGRHESGNQNSGRDYGQVLGLSTVNGHGVHTKAASYKHLFKPAQKHHAKQSNHKMMKRVVNRYNKTVKNSYNKTSYEETTNNHIKDSVVNQTEVNAGDNSSVNVQSIAADHSLVFAEQNNDTTIEDNDTTEIDIDNSTNDSNNSEVNTEVKDSYNKEKKVENNDSFNTKKVNLDVELEVDESFNHLGGGAY